MVNRSEPPARLERGGLNRRDLLRRSGLGIGLGSAGLVAALTGVGGSHRALAAVAPAGLQDDPAAGTQGGTLRVAPIGEPPTLDEHQTTASITAEIGYCMYETLFTYDPSYQPIPMLAETHTVSEDKSTHTLKLRQGVPFHNGEMMTADDVVASINRWGQISGVGKGSSRRSEVDRRSTSPRSRFRLTRPTARCRSPSPTTPRPASSIRSR